MMEFSTIARPYAKAVFELADQDKSFEKWSFALSFLTSIVNDKTMQRVLEDPLVSKPKLTEIIAAVATDKLDKQAYNFVEMLIDKNRLKAVNAISKQYEILRAQAESVVTAAIESALPLNQTQLDKLTISLEKHFGKKVKLSANVNKDLMGGILIRAGDTVIDGSVRTKLEKMASTIRA